MKTLSQVFALKPVKGEWGIEIEAEGEGMQEVHSKYWKCEDDGSLRGRWPATRNEFVLHRPINTDQVEDAVDDLVKALPYAKFNFSHRTSVHVHMNVCTLTRDQICSIIYLYLLFEEPLINFCGESRKANRFALRLRDAEHFMEALYQMFRNTTDDWWALGHDQYRYASINLEAMRKYMSIEFRGMRGTIDKEIITTWVSLLNFIKEYASNHSVKQISDRVQKVGAMRFAQEVFGELANVLAYPDMDRDMAMSYSLAIDLPYQFIPSPIEKPIEKPEVIGAKKVKPIMFEVIDDLL